ncbi:MAG: peptidoglycan-binding protein [Rhodobacterales bacterium]|nr:peptidoglycan-binding protein [Rhodobacterales bacterium]MDX5412556.1 peptidoglycan-binding protein [Rhodobacterales bacterium]
MTPSRPALRLALPLVALLGLAACTPVASDNPADSIMGSMLDVPPGAPAGTCWGKIVSPALIETVTEQVLVEPARLAADGTVATPAIFRTETRQRIVTEREVTWFETPCPDAVTPELIATLQRALAARDLYAGPVTGQIDPATSAGVRRYQAQTGLDSPILSLAAARSLGLIATPRDQLSE